MLSLKVRYEHPTLAMCQSNEALPCGLVVTLLETQALLKGFADYTHCEFILFSKELGARIEAHGPTFICCSDGSSHGHDN